MSDHKTSSGCSSSDAIASLPRFQSLLAKAAKAANEPDGRVCLIGSNRPATEWLRNRLYRDLAAESSTASIDAGSKNPTDCLSSMLGQFGYDFASKNRNELLGMLRVFAVHQSDAGNRPVLFVRNAHRISAELIVILNELNQITSNREPAIAVVLFGHPPLLPWLKSLGLDDAELFSKHSLTVEPFGAAEVVRYVKARCGLTIRDLKLLEDVLQNTDGNPDQMDKLIAGARRRGEISEFTLAESLAAPPSQSANDDTEAEARIIVSQSGQLVSEQTLVRQRSMIGRAEHNDLMLDSRYVSRYHALLVKGPEESDWIVDLNSRNGTFVNSRAIDYMALRHDDVISLGNHRLKYVNPAATGRRPARAAFAGNATAVFETLRADGGPDLSLLTQNLRKPG